MNGIFTISSVQSRSVTTEVAVARSSQHQIFLYIWPVSPLTEHEATSQEARDLWLTNKLLNLSHKNLMYLWKKWRGLN